MTKKISIQYSCDACGRILGDIIPEYVLYHGKEQVKFYCAKCGSLEEADRVDEEFIPKMKDPSKQEELEL